MLKISDPLCTHLVHEFTDVDEARSLHRLARQIVLHSLERPSELLPALLVDPAPLTEGRLWRDALVVGVEHGGGLVGLDPAAGLGRLVGLGEDVVPVGYAAREPAHVDEVECSGREGPFLGAVFDFTGGRETRSSR